MSSLQVVATLPTNGDPAAAEALSTLAAASREEEGCLRYDIFASASASGVFVTIEEWRSQEDLDAHMTTPHIGQAFEVVGPMLTGEVTIHPLQDI